MNYPVADRALKTWNSKRLERLEDGKDLKSFRFHFEGSTCNNVGDAFIAFFHVKIDEEMTIQKAWIELPEESKKAACQMCASPSRTPAEAADFLGSFSKDADFTGRPLEEVILEEKDLNYAGCLCRQPMVDQKWKMVLSTVHFNLFQTLLTPENVLRSPLHKAKGL